MTSVELGLDLARLQGHRLMQAVMEAGVTVVVPGSEVANLKYLAEQGFSTNYTFEASDSTGLRAGFDHSLPKTWLGEETRPLIFPHAVVEKAQSDNSVRDLRYSFAGLVTPARRSAFDKFSLAAGETLPDLDALSAKVRRRVAARLNRSASFTSASGRTTLWYSRRGRAFPTKLWDEEYFAIMRRSEFVLCPSGVHVWSYRFFEAMLAGAIPVVEEPADCYEGFEYRMMSDPNIGSSSWRQDVAEHNLELARRRLTLPAARIRELVSGYGRLA